MFRVIAIYDFYEECFHVFDREINFKSFDDIKKGVNKYLPPFHVSPDLRSEKFYAEEFYPRQSFIRYIFRDSETGEEFSQYVLQLDFLLELDSKEYSMDGDYRVRIDIACNSESEVQAFNSNPHIQMVANPFAEQMVIVKKFSPREMPKIFKSIRK